MWLRVADFKRFYSSRIGNVAQEMILQKLRMIFPNVAGRRILGLGYSQPYLGNLSYEAHSFLAIPVQHGILHGLEKKTALTTLVREDELPFPDLSMDIVIIIHALEFTDSIRPTLREVWRVLSDSGELFVIVPNRYGLWSRFENTPFGFGRPFTKTQISQVLEDNLFTPTHTHQALFFPPVESKLLLSGARVLEATGRYFLSSFSGVVMTHAVKKIYSAATLLEAASRRKYATITERSIEKLK